MVDTNFLDQYSLQHFVSGIIAYYIGISFEQWFWIHVIFEILENSPQMILLFNRLIFNWAGRDYKKIPDFLINSIGDQICAIVGWFLAYLVDKYIFKRVPTPITRNKLTANIIPGQ